MQCILRKLKGGLDRKEYLFLYVVIGVVAEIGKGSCRRSCPDKGAPSEWPKELEPIRCRPKKEDEALCKARKELAVALRKLGGLSCRVGDHEEKLLVARVVVALQS